mmetsp:Transcript_55431/g.120813  ORF Transcript_55431/g.120813 Transcript_55431/m.120813 type:complete len:345 (+) Transcript_55431:261-1295(+)
MDRDLFATGLCRFFDNGLCLLDPLLETPGFLQCQVLRAARDVDQHQVLAGVGAEEQVCEWVPIGRVVQTSMLDCVQSEHGHVASAVADSVVVDGVVIDSLVVDSEGHVVVTVEDSTVEQLGAADVEQRRRRTKLQRAVNCCSACKCPGECGLERGGFEPFKCVMRNNTSKTIPPGVVHTPFQVVDQHQLDKPEADVAIGEHNEVVQLAVRGQCLGRVGDAGKHLCSQLLIRFFERERKRSRAELDAFLERRLDLLLPDRTFQRRLKVSKKRITGCCRAGAVEGGKTKPSERVGEDKPQRCPLPLDSSVAVVNRRVQTGKVGREERVHGGINVETWQGHRVPAHA